MNWNKMVSFCAITVLVLSTISMDKSYAIQNSGENNQSASKNQDAAEIGSKSEVVYSKLSAEGKVNAVYIVNHFEVEKGGSITEFGNYQSVQNLTESEPITQNGDSVSFQAEAGDFYYQGNLKSHDLPWTIELTYALNGVEISPQDLAGKSGKLKIHIKTNQNRNENAAFYENYMLQISLTLDDDKCNHISAPEAAAADAGNNTILAFTVMPDNDADFEVAADVIDFTMKGIELSAVPFSLSMNLPDTDGLLEDFEMLPEAISELNDGIGKLADGTSNLKKGADELKNCSGKFDTGLSELKKNSADITNASSQIKSALGKIASSLSSDTSETELGALTQLSTVLNELSDGLKEISDGLKELREGYSLAYSALNSALQGIPETEITQEQINQHFPDTDENQRKLLNQLYASYVAGQTAKGTYHQVKQTFASVVPAMETMSVSIDTISEALDVMSGKIKNSLSATDLTAQLGQLTGGLTELASNYSKFDKGLKEYINGVSMLSDGYHPFNSGLTEFANGVGELDQGISELHDGSEILYEEVSKMPDLIQEEIDKTMDEYKTSDFQPISFVSSKNTNTDFVQFVLKSDEIKRPKEAVTTEETKKDETIIDRLMALFKND